MEVHCGTRSKTDFFLESTILHRLSHCHLTVVCCGALASVNRNENLTLLDLSRNHLKILECKCCVMHWFSQYVNYRHSSKLLWWVGGRWMGGGQERHVGFDHSPSKRGKKKNWGQAMPRQNIRVSEMSSRPPPWTQGQGSRQRTGSTGQHWISLLWEAAWHRKKSTRSRFC